MEPGVRVEERVSTGKPRTPADLERVGRWLEWCAQNQAASGYWNDFEGTVAGYRNNGKVDAWDSSAALFLLVAGRYQRAGGKATPAIVAAARKALKCIETVADGDGERVAGGEWRVASGERREREGDAGQATELSENCQSNPISDWP